MAEAIQKKMPALFGEEIELLKQQVDEWSK